jgi:hypothetical protein
MILQAFKKADIDNPNSYISINDEKYRPYELSQNMIYEEQNAVYII